MPVWHFPKNLKSKPTIIVWEVKDLSVIVVGFMVSFYFLLSSSFVLPGIAVAVYAVMTTRISEYTILSGVIACLKFFILEAQEYDWQAPELPAEKQAKPKKSAESNVDKAVRKKRRMILARTFLALLMLASAAGIGYYSYQKQRREQAVRDLQDRLYIRFADTDAIEYGNEHYEVRSLILGFYGRVQTDPEMIDTSVIGPVTISCNVTKATEYGDEASRTYQKIVEVKDTVPPVIEIGAETVVLHVDQSYDAASNIHAVYDPVDGDLERSDTLEYGTYTVTGHVDMHHPGSYPITVDACDINGKNTTLIYFVEVHE